MTSEITTGWIVYNKSKWISKSFATKDDARNWLTFFACCPFMSTEDSSLLWKAGVHVVIRGPRNKDCGWDGPIPVVKFRGGNKSALERMRLSQFDPPNDEPRSGSELVDLVLDDCLGIEINPVVFAVEKLGFANGETAERAALSEEQLHQIEELASELRPPTIECSLDETWLFTEIIARACALGVHSRSVRCQTNLSELRGIALEIEQTLLLLHPDCCIEDLFRFWTSFQVAEYFCKMLQRLKARPNDPPRDAHLMFCRWLASYSHSLRLDMKSSGTVLRPSGSQVRESENDGSHRDGHSDPETLLGLRPLVTSRTAAKAIGVSGRRVRQLVEEGTLTATGQGPRRRILTETIRAYLKLPDRKVEESGKKR